MSTHWLVTPSNEPHMRTACRMPLIDGNGSTTQDQVTCPECLAAVIRAHCNAVADEPGPLPARCARPPHKHGSHDWVPGSDALRHADFARQALDRVVRNPQSAEAYAMEAQRQADSNRLDAEQRLARLADEPKEQDTPSGMLPVRTPGAALRDAGEGSGGRGDPDEAARASESILGRRVIERWPA